MYQLFRSTVKKYINSNHKLREIKKKLRAANKFIKYKTFGRKKTIAECNRLFYEIKNKPFPEVQRSDYERNCGKLLQGTAVVEINNTCNLDCLMCKTSLSARTKGLMPLDKLDFSMKYLRDNGFNTIQVHTIGEPLVNRKIDRVFELARKNKINISLQTNGLLVYKHINTLLDNKDILNSLSFSIDGVHKSTYEKIRVGGKFDILIENLELVKEKLIPSGIGFSIGMTVSKDNIGEFGEFVEFFRNYVSDPRTGFDFGLMDSLSPDNTYFDEVKLFPKHYYKNHYCQSVAKLRPHVLIDGRVSVCCRDYDGELIAGTIPENSMEELNNSSQMKDLRRAHESGDLSSYNLCDTCYRPDSRISSIFSLFTKYLIFNTHNRPAEYIQDKINQFVYLLESEDYDLSAKKLTHLINQI